MEDFVVDYGLECRVSLTTFRLFFIENSRDFLYKKGTFKQSNSRLSPSNIQTKKENLEKIISKLKSAKEIVEQDENVNIFNE